MHCARLEKDIDNSECPPIVTATRDSALLNVCRACPQGIVLASRARMPGNYYKPQDFKMVQENVGHQPPQVQGEEKMTEEAAAYAPEEPKREGITLSELASLAGVSYGTAWNVSRMQPKSGKNADKLNAKLDELGLTWDDLVPSSKGGPREKKTTPHNLKKLAAELTAPEQTSKAEVAPVVIAGQNYKPLEELLRDIKALLPHGVRLTIEI